MKKKISIITLGCKVNQYESGAIAKELEDALVLLENSYKNYSQDLQTLYGNIKEDILKASPTIKEEDIEISENLFVSDDTYEEYPYCAKIELEGATSDLFPNVNFKIKDALSGNYAPVADSGQGYITIYAKEIPTQSLIISSVVLQ